MARALADRGRPWMAALAGFALAALAATWPLAARLGSATYGGPGDGWALIWQTRLRLEEGIDPYAAHLSHAVAWPFGAELPSAVLLSNAVTELPNLLLLAVGVGDVAAYNLVVLLGLVASSMAMYATLRGLGGAAPVAFWAGLVYMLAPWHLDRAMVHPSLTLMAALPLLLLGIVRWGRDPGTRSGALVAGATGLAVYTHAYYGLFAGLVLLLALPPILLAARARGRLAATAGRSALLGGAIALVAAPLALALLLDAAAVGGQLDRPLYLQDLASSAHLYALPAVGNPLFGDLSAEWLQERSLPANVVELALYPGWITVALGAVALIAIGRGRMRDRLAAAAAAAAMTALGLVLALPATVTLPLLGPTATPIAHLQDLLTFVSTPARAFALTLTGLVVLAALGLEHLTRHGPGRVPGAALVAVAAVLSAAELVVSPSDRLVSTDPPPVVRAIERHVPDGAALAQYPSVDRGLRPIADQLFWQLEHGHPLLNGAASRTLEDEVRHELSRPEDPRLPAALALLGIGWATHEPAAYAAVPPEGVGDAYEYAPPAGLETVERLADGARLMRVTAAPAPGLAVRAEGLTREAPHDELRTMTARTAALLVCATAPGRHRLAFRARSAIDAVRLRVGDGAAVLRPEGEPPVVLVRVELRAGWQWVPLRLEPIRPGARLVAALGPIVVAGPEGDPAACRTRLPAAPA